ncbi:MAG: beta-lactamase family protein [Treponema sp.]|nr:beta-lactamase family protein [Treponema sp.]
MKKVQNEKIKEFEEYIAQLMTKEEAVGIAVAVIDSEGNNLYENYFGYRDAEKKLSINSDTVFGIASITKSFTSLASMLLAEKSLLKIEDPVSLHMPEFAHKNITIEHLLTHSGGFYPQPRKYLPQFLEDSGYKISEDDDPAFSGPLTKKATEQLLDALNKVDKMIGPPGEFISYCNDGYNLLGSLLCRLSGIETFAALVDKYILSPLSMTRSSSAYNWKDENVSRLYQHREGKLCGDWNFYESQSSLPAAGALKSTISDMKKYARMYLNRGQLSDKSRFISSKGVERMIRPYINSGLNSYYGYGLRIKPLADLTIIEHGGDNPGVSSNMAFNYETGIAVIILCNTSKVSVASASDLAMLIFSGKDTTAFKQTPEPVEWDEEFMKQVCGTYLSGEGNTIRIGLIDKQFSVNLDGSETIAYPFNNYMINVKAKVDDIRAKIYTDDAGKVWALGGGLRIIPKVE